MAFYHLPSGGQIGSPCTVRDNTRGLQGKLPTEIDTDNSKRLHLLFGASSHFSPLATGAGLVEDHRNRVVKNSGLHGQLLQFSNRVFLHGLSMNSSEVVNYFLHH